MIEFLNLPPSTEVGRVIPKSAFEDVINSHQRKLFTEKIKKITWANKLSEDTINLKSHEVKEIEIFIIELKVQEEIEDVLKIIYRNIPYHIICWIQYADNAMLSTAIKHENPQKANTSVVDWMFITGWFKLNENRYKLNLKESLDAVVKDLCIQISGQHEWQGLSSNEIVANQKLYSKLTMEIAKLREQLKRKKQFNERVEINLKIKQLESELSRILY